MAHEKNLTVDQERLVSAWKHALSAHLRDADSTEVYADELDSQAIRIQIKTASREKYAFDFICTYVDAHEVKVELADVQRDQESIDEHTEEVQLMVKGYVQQIHRCAQELQALTDEKRR